MTAGTGTNPESSPCRAVVSSEVEGYAPPSEAVAYVRDHYNRRAVETPWQHRYIARFCVP